MIGKNGFRPTKGKDYRYVPYSEGLKEEIHKLLIHEIEAQDPERTLFVSKAQTPIDHDNFLDRVFKKDVRDSGLREIRFHDLRHTAITLWVKKNVPLAIVQKIAGHKDIKTTLRYVHVLGRDIEEIGLGFGLTSQVEESGKVLKLV